MNYHLIIFSLFAYDKLDGGESNIISGSCLGSRQLSAKQVAQKAVEELLSELDHGAPVDCYTQDQVCDITTFIDSNLLL